jgi:hypothetical protein
LAIPFSTASSVDSFPMIMKNDIGVEIFDYTFAIDGVRVNFLLYLLFLNLAKIFSPFWNLLTPNVQSSTLRCFFWALQQLFWGKIKSQQITARIAIYALWWHCFTKESAKQRFIWNLLCIVCLIISFVWWLVWWVIC